MKEYITPELTIKKIRFDDIIVTSGGEGGVGTVTKTDSDTSVELPDDYY